MRTVLRSGKLLLTCCFLHALCHLGFAQEPHAPELRDPSEWADVLTQGWKERDGTARRSFLDEWEGTSAPVPFVTLHCKPAFEQAVYAIFAEFFAPEASRKRGEYAIVQQSVWVHLSQLELAAVYRADAAHYRKSSLFQGIISRFEVHDFRPELKIEGKKVLYLNDKRLDAMLQFLTGKHEYLVKDYWSEPNGAVPGYKKREGRRKRLRYLNESLGILPGHWGTGWHFETHPHVNVVVLHAELKTAILHYRDGWGGGQALMEYGDEGWTVKEKGNYWTE